MTPYRHLNNRILPHKITAFKVNPRARIARRRDRNMHNNMIAAVVLVFTFTIAECKHIIDKKQLPPDPSCQIISPDLQRCIDALDPVDNTVFCDTDCEAELLSFIEVCVPSVLEEFIQGYAVLCGEPTSGSGDPSGSGDDACLPINFSSDLEDCLNSYAAITPGTTVSDSPACSPECSYEIEDYADRCLSTTTAQMYKDEYRRVCGLPSGE